MLLLGQPATLCAGHHAVLPRLLPEMPQGVREDDNTTTTNNNNNNNDNDNNKRSDDNNDNNDSVKC